MNENEPIPDNMQAVKWMDGANAQGKWIISKENLDDDKEENKTMCCKHSATQTTAEQAADASPNFKLMKK